MYNSYIYAYLYSVYIDIVVLKKFTKAQLRRRNRYKYITPLWVPNMCLRYELVRESLLANIAGENY